MARTPKATKIVVKDAATGAPLHVIDLGTVGAQTYGSPDAAQQPIVSNPTTRAVTLEIIAGDQSTSSPATLISVAGTGGGGGSGVAPSITTQPQSVTITQGLTTTLSVVAAGDAPLAYQWRFGGTNIAGATSPTYVASQPGSYTVVVTNATGSVTSNAAVVTVLPQPVPAFTVTPTGGAVPLTVTLDNQSTDIVAGDEYSWTFGDGNTSVAAEPGTHTYTTAGSRPINLTVRRNGITYGPATRQISVTGSSTTQNVTVTVGPTGRNVANVVVDNARNDGDPAQNYGAAANIPMHRWGTDYWRLFVRWPNFDADIAAAVAFAQAATPGATSAVATAVRLGVRRVAADAAQLATVVELTSTWTEAAAANPGIGAPLGALAFNADVGDYLSSPLAGLLTNPNRVHGVAVQLDASSAVGTNTVNVATREWGAASPYLSVDVTVTVLGGGGVAPDVTDITVSPSSGWTTATNNAFTLTNVGGPISTYAWVFKLGGLQVGTSSLAVPSYTFTSPGAASVEVTVTGAGGTDFLAKPIGTIIAAGGGGGGGAFVFGQNLSSMADWEPPQTVDAVRQSRGFGALGEFDENLSISRDANFWPLVACTNVISAAAEYPGVEYVTGVWKGRYVDNTGTQATMSVAAIGNSTITNIVRSGNVVTFDWTVSSGPTLILSFSAGVRDLRIVMPGNDPAVKPPMLSPLMLAYCAKWGGMRSLDFVGQNPNTTEALSEPTWAARQPDAKVCGGRKTWAAFIDAFLEARSASGSRCNVIWPNMPFRWDEASMLACAQYFASRLPAGAIKMPEWSNETWNPIYGTKWNYLLAIANNTSHPDYAIINTPATTDQWTRLGRLWALQAARMARAWKTAFPGEFGTTLRPLLVSQMANMYWIRDIMIPWLKLPAQVAEFGPFENLFYAISGACYTGGEEAQMATPANATEFLKSLNGDPTALQFFTYNLQRLATLNDPAQGSMLSWKNLATQHGVKVGAYEGGIHTHDSQNLAVKMATHLAPGMNQHVLDLVHAAKTQGWDFFFWLSGRVAKYVATNENTFTWPIAQGFLPANSTPKWDAAQILLAE